VSLWCGEVQKVVVDLSTLVSTKIMLQLAGVHKVMQIHGGQSLGITVLLGPLADKLSKHPSATLAAGHTSPKASCMGTLGHQRVNLRSPLPYFFIVFTRARKPPLPPPATT
jgi:hypothetical protein